MLSHNVEIKINEKIDKAILEELSHWCETILDLVFNENICLSLNLTTKEEIKKLNSQFRHIDATTNVLSFPDEWPPELVQGMHLRFIGDVVICSAVLQEESIEQSKLLANHWQHMLVHGILHLAGYDHVSDNGALEMEQLEVKILATMNVPNPYIENN